jgi:predicted metal-dependent phosphoesterase TrpH
MIMPFDNPFACEGNWYKANLHAHTTESDGKLSPEAVAAHYRRQGYHALAITDHGKVTPCREFSAHDFICIEGIEIGSGNSEVDRAFHIVGLDVPESVASAPTGNPQATLDAIAEAGGIGFVAHPG